MQQVQITVPVLRFGETSRRDNWWVQPLVVFLGLSATLHYLNWAAFQAGHYEYFGYLSPLYAPELFSAFPTCGSVPDQDGGQAFFRSRWHFVFCGRRPVFG